MASSTKPQAPKEHEVQKAIVDALRLCGLTVYETTAYRQKGSSGVDKGIPDLLVRIPFNDYWYLGMEVKRPGPVKWSSPEQALAYNRKEFYLVQSVEDALRICSDVIWERYGECVTFKRLESALRGLS